MSKKLEQYLFELEKNLADLPPSQRAKIISEINQHIEEAQSNYPDKTVAQILDDLGPASKVANHYRLDNGYKTFKPTKNPILKWLSITFLGTVLISALAIGILVWKFTPVIKIDEKSQRFMLFGGLIDINGKSGKVKVFDQYQFVENKYTNEFEGKYKMEQKQDEVIVKFDIGKMKFNNSLNRDISWKCKLETPPTKDIVELKQDSVRLRLDEFGGGSCEISIPSDTQVTIDGLEGEVEINQPEYDLFVDLESGNINFIHAPEVEYNYSLRVEKGMKNQFPEGSTSPNAYEIQLELENGSLNYE